MKNKTAIIGLLLMFIGFGHLVAQEGGDKAEKRKVRKEKVRAMKKSFIKKELSLTAAQETVFWPIYDEHEIQREALRKKHRETRKKYKGKSPEELTDVEAEDILDSEMAFREKQLALEKAYGIKLKNALPIKKALMLRKAERKFKKQLLDRMKKGQARRGVSNGPSEHPAE